MDIYIYILIANLIEIVKHAKLDRRLCSLISAGENTV